MQQNKLSVTGHMTYSQAPQRWVRIRFSTYFVSLSQWKITPRASTCLVSNFSEPFPASVVCAWDLTDGTEVYVHPLTADAKRLHAQMGRVGRSWCLLGVVGLFFLRHILPISTFSRDFVAILPLCYQRCIWSCEEMCSQRKWKYFRGENNQDFQLQP